MSRLDYWHPVLDRRRLPADRAVGVKVAGRSLALFRAGGRPAAVDDQCAHRRMKLSLGTVCRERLVCPYHGWSFDRDGRGESPSAPRVQAGVTSYDCAESRGVVWVKSRGSAGRTSRSGKGRVGISPARCSTSCGRRCSSSSTTSAKSSTRSRLIRTSASIRPAPARRHVDIGIDEDCDHGPRSRSSENATASTRG